MFAPLMILSFDQGHFADPNPPDGPRRYQLLLQALSAFGQRLRTHIRAIGASDAEVSGRVSFSAR